MSARSETFEFDGQGAESPTKGKVEAPRVFFLDIEASGLGSRSWPVEVGWAGPGIEPVSVLLKPHDSWEASAWEAEAEALHGISMLRLQAEGEHVVDACRQINEALDGACVYSDAPDFDGVWLYRLYTAAGRRMSFRLLDFGALVDEVAGAAVSAAYAHGAAVAPRTHRAADDAAHLAAVYARARGLAAGK